MRSGSLGVGTLADLPDREHPLVETLPPAAEDFPRGHPAAAPPTLYLGSDSRQDLWPLRTAGRVTPPARCVCKSLWAVRFTTQNCPPSGHRAGTSREADIFQLLPQPLPTGLHRMEFAIAVRAVGHIECGLSEGQVNSRFRDQRVSLGINCLEGQSGEQGLEGKSESQVGGVAPRGRFAHLQQVLPRRLPITWE